MAKGKAKGFSYVGKEVQTHDFRVDKEFFINRSKASSQGKVNGLDVDQSGKMIISPKAISGIAIDDDNVAIDARDLEPGILTITPTASRVKPTPTAAQIVAQFGFTEFYQNADIPILNLATANYSLTLTAGTDVTLVGDMTIAPNSTGLFRFVVSHAGIGQITIYRIAGSDSTTVDNLLAGNGIDLSGSTGNITVSAEDASTTNPGIVELATTAETTTGTDTARAVTPDGLKDGYQGSTNVVTVGTIGTGTWNATAIASAKMATGTSSAQGALELATTAEADTGTDTARAVTPAGLKSHVDARFSYQYIALSMNSSTPADGDWMIASGNGIGNHLYNQNVGAGGTTPHNTDGSASQITISKNILSGGIIVPYDCTLVGFYAHSRASSNDQKALGLFTGTATWNDYADITGFLRAYSEQDISAGPDTSYSVRPVEHSVLNINKALSAGDQMWPASRSVGGGAGGCITSMTIVLKTLIP